MAEKRGRPRKNPVVPQEPIGESIVEEQPVIETPFQCPCGEDHSMESLATGEDPGDYATLDPPCPLPDGMEEVRLADFEIWLYLPITKTWHQMRRARDCSVLKETE